jgi:hypothetical protein
MLSKFPILSIAQAPEFVKCFMRVLPIYIKKNILSVADGKGKEEGRAQTCGGGIIRS